MRVGVCRVPGVGRAPGAWHTRAGNALNCGAFENVYREVLLGFFSLPYTNLEVRFRLKPFKTKNKSLGFILFQVCVS